MLMLINETQATSDAAKTEKRWDLKNNNFKNIWNTTVQIMFQTQPVSHCCEHKIPFCIAVSCFCFILHRGSESADWFTGPVTHYGAETGGLTGAYADRGWLVWCPPRPHRFPGWSSLPAALSGPAASCLKGLCQSSLPLTVTSSMYLEFRLFSFQPSLLQRDHFCFHFITVTSLQCQCCENDRWPLIATLHF